RCDPSLLDLQSKCAGCCDLIVSNFFQSFESCGVITMIVLLTTMVSLGCTMEIGKIKEHLVRPQGVFTALIAQFGIMPLTAFVLARCFELSPVEAVTVLICGCCPGGNLSNIFAFAMQGDMNLSIVMTASSTVLALGMMPLLLYVYTRGLSNEGPVIPYAGIFLSLAVTLIPCGVGIYINFRYHKYSRIVLKVSNCCVGMVILIMAAMAIGILSGFHIGSSIWSVLSPTLISIAALMPALGYLLGYFIATGFHLPMNRWTIAMETGCQNIQLCMAILKVVFPVEVIGSLFLFPLLYVLFQILWVLLAIIFINFYRCCKNPPEPTCGEYTTPELSFGGN
uniref:Solute carrier family 10 member 1 n=1 Tax=Eptatretus burgeri TaxID=7764 RepID=A0A8C4QXX3_EPTBU